MRTRRARAFTGAVLAVVAVAFFGGLIVAPVVAATVFTVIVGSSLVLFMAGSALGWILDGEPRRKP